MTNQERFEQEAKQVVRRNQATFDTKFWLSHWGGYASLRDAHRKEIQALAQKYGVDVKLRKWKLNTYFMWPLW